MTPADITRYIQETYGDVYVHDADGDLYFFRGEERKFPFATLMVRDDDYDQSGQLDREGVFRLNVGVGKETFRGLFGEGGEYDYAALDRPMPHPVYGKMLWLGVLNPGRGTFEAFKPLLAESYERQGRR